VTIQLQDEARLNTVMTWKIKGARPMKYSGPAFNAKASSDVAIE
jgi:phage tail-like protein